MGGFGEGFVNGKVLYLVARTVITLAIESSTLGLRGESLPLGVIHAELCRTAKGFEM
jgi:hypothetical protein